jgi:hypothetical protein
MERRREEKSTVKVETCAYEADMGSEGRGDGQRRDKAVD